MGVKRSHDHAMMASGDDAGSTATHPTRASKPTAAAGRQQQHGDATAASVAAISPFMPMFDRFRAELDEHHDRRERIIKASRDVTAASKKIIFTLQRIRTLNQPLPPNIIKSNAQYHSAIITSLSSIVPDLQPLNSDRYARQISPGAQEWMEAASFQHYLTTATLLSYPDAAQQLRDLTPASEAGDASSLNNSAISLSYEDYILGIFDMTGELMRFAITAMATSGVLPAIADSGPGDGSTTSTTTKDADAMDVSQNTNKNDPTNSISPGNSSTRRTLLTDLRALRSALETLDVSSLGGYFAKDVEKKMDVMRQSVEKVERGLYGLIVRGAERPKGWMPDVSSSDAHAHAGGAGRGVEVEG